MGTLTLDERRYRRLVAKAAPRVIHTHEEHERTLAAVESLIAKGEDAMTPEDDALLELLTNLIETYERSIYGPLPEASPGEMVQFLLEQRGLTPKDLWPTVGSKSRVSEILAGKRRPSRAQAKDLAEFFHVGVEAFL